LGTFSVTVEVGDPTGTRWQSIEMLVDTGAMFSLIPSSILRALGVDPQWRMEFEIATGGIIEREVAETWVRYQGKSHHTPAIFGDEDSSPLLGAYTLEGFLLGVDPFNQRLVPVRGLLMRED
jgi:clan AA aspartic protease